MSATASLCEVFSGIQGEGVHVGVRQVFVRFAGCNLSCLYCDTPEARKATRFAQVEQTPGGREFGRSANPMPAPELAAALERLDKNHWHDSVCLTGGEPLLAADFISEFAPLCEGRRFYLETNGTLPGELEKVIGLVHTVAMDIKIASSAGYATAADIWREFRSVATAAEVFAKVVVADKTSSGELTQACEVIASVGKDIPLVVQPVTPGGHKIQPPGPTRLLELQAAALDVLDDVRVIPQVHKLMGQK